MLAVDPHIHYARSSDGVNIAWYAIGSGVPYVIPQTPIGAGLVDSWHIPEQRALYEFIAQGARLVVYDPRGFGLSDRGVTDLSCDAFVRDLEAVVQTAELEPFILHSFSFNSMPALMFAARHPTQVRALILLNGIARGSDLTDSWQRLRGIAAEDWDYARGMLLRRGAYFASTATYEQAEALLSQGITQDAFLAFSEAVTSWDASDAAGQVETPALVVHSTPSLYMRSEASRRLATTLPNGTFAPITATDAAVRLQTLTQTSLRFLRDIVPRPTATKAPAANASRMAVILFTDIADSTALTEQQGDSAFRASSRALDDSVRAAIRQAGGEPVDGKVLGDGVMGVFQSAVHAIDSARACIAAAAAVSLPIHVGLHAGDVIHEEDNFYGGAVNLAARVCQLSEPGEILVSGTVRELARTSSSVGFEDRGEYSVKGIADAVRVFAVASEQEA